jgi:putative transposase
MTVGSAWGGAARLGVGIDAHRAPLQSGHWHGAAERKSTVAAVYDRRERMGGASRLGVGIDAHRAPLQSGHRQGIAERKSTVAAVYDRRERMGGASLLGAGIDAHRAPLQSGHRHGAAERNSTVAAVYDRRQRMGGASRLGSGHRRSWSAATIRALAWGAGRRCTGNLDQIPLACYQSIDNSPPSCFLMARLARLEWLFRETPLFFVTICTAGRRSLLAEESAFQAFRAFCLAAGERGVLVGRFVLMPDHLHLMAGFNPGACALSIWVKSLKNSLSKHWRSQGIGVPHWQKGFFDHLLRSPESHEQKWAYVRENPVRAGLVVRPEDWPFAGEIHHL